MCTEMSRHRRDLLRPHHPKLKMCGTTGNVSGLVLRARLENATRGTDLQPCRRHRSWLK